MIKTLFFRSFFLLALLAIGSTSCDESNISIHTLEGEWTWKRTYGGLMGLNHEADELGITIHYTFSTDQTFTESVNGISTRTGSYFLSEENDNVPTTDNDLPFLNLSFDSMYQPDGNEQYVLYSGGYQINLSENMMILDSGLAADGLVYEFEQ